jgi:hypothetical protein
MLLATMICTMLVGMLHLFQVTWATQNAHIRAREFVMHKASYLDNHAPRGDYVSVGSSQWEESPWDDSALNYRKAGYNGARPGGVDTPYEFTAIATDATRNDSFGQQEIKVTATITNQ